MEMTHAIIADKANQQHTHSSSFVLLISDFSEWAPVCACSLLALNIWCKPTAPPQPTPPPYLQPRPNTHHPIHFQFKFQSRCCKNCLTAECESGKLQQHCGIAWLHRAHIGATSSFPIVVIIFKEGRFDCNNPRVVSRPQSAAELLVLTHAELRNPTTPMTLSQAPRPRLSEVPRYRPVSIKLVQNLSKGPTKVAPE